MFLVIHYDVWVDCMRNVYRYYILRITPHLPNPHLPGGEPCEPGLRLICLIHICQEENHVNQGLVLECRQQAVFFLGGGDIMICELIILGGPGHSSPEILNFESLKRHLLHCGGGTWRNR
jgi:hypothetical protein